MGKWYKMKLKTQLGGKLWKAFILLPTFFFVFFYKAIKIDILSYLLVSEGILLLWRME